ncbi:hypothetical protein [Arthrobacter sp. NicSoilB8]|uniref:hypothetical protein n=1 Tax=Arthrobacter sp. NicSoilB8 TaxID=2830998 RepID=UPI001CC3965D|nr:hypothetical protein [Arthrobacter sp. NicSoilB8]BCW72383.1 hypothetical protein NicSoilB8_34270 [Arthrobacter sp. NicSoilB8]
MTMSEVWPQLRPLCRKLALLGWAASAAGMAAGLAVAIASGTRLSPMMSTLQLVAGLSMAVSVGSFVTAAALQPRARSQARAQARSRARSQARTPEGVKPGPAASRGQELQLDYAGEFPATVQAFLLGSLALLAGAVAFACAGLVLQSGPSVQSVAFCQVFLLGAAASGFTFMLFSKVAPRHTDR